VAGQAIESNLGDVIENGELRTLDGRRETLLARKALANVLVFFRPEHEHSLDTLKALARCEKEFGTKPVHWVALVSDTSSPDAVRAAVRESGIQMPVLWDAGDALYGKLEVRLHPFIFVLDGKGKVTAREPFLEINYCDVVRARIRRTLGEIGDAEVARALDPPASTTRTEEGVARRHLNLARQLVRIEQLDTALEEVKKSLALVPTAGAYALEGKILAAQGKCAAAVPVFEAALKMDPKDPVALEGKQGCAR
jgi:tetratricopeptide (TPR) repeat protein